MTSTTARDVRETQAAEPLPAGPFEAAAAAYHPRIGEAFGRYQRRCEELRIQYAQALDAAYKEPTPALIQQRIEAANEDASKRLIEITKATNDDVEQSLRGYLNDLKNAWAKVNIDDL